MYRHSKKNKYEYNVANGNCKFSKITSSQNMERKY